ncbi:MAG: TIGR04211 family SH3 domain-containing protein [Gammaproteobacteria bacterium]|nr:TIGR04211 family SH3 domain-containing protein [Gammaproteobacteria bacterium]
MRYWLMGFALFLGVSSVTMAETRYVMDVMYVTLRTTAGEDSSLVKTIRSGTKLEILEDTGDYVRASMEDGTEGWVRSRYLQNQPTAAERLASLERELAAVTKERDSLKSSSGEFKDKAKDTDKELKRLLSENQKLEKQFKDISEAAAEPLKLSKQNEELTASNATMRTELETLRHKVTEMEDTSDLEWFISGGIIIFVGVLIGLVLPNLRSRRGSWA